jgi:FAD/FMN-containing dehydrogenase
MESLSVETVRLSDWSGFTDFGGSAPAQAPRNEDEVVRLVRHCRANRKKLRVVGLRTSWNAWWHCPDVLMSTGHLNAIGAIDAARRTVTCDAGVTLTDLHQALWERGLTLDTAPAIGWVTVGGALSTASHGSGPASMSSSMVRCRLVTAKGEVLEVGEGDDLLDAVRVSQGMLGVLASVTLKVVDGFHVSVKRTHIPTRDWKRFLTEGEMSYLQWFPHTASSALVTVRVLSRPGQHPIGSATVGSEGPVDAAGKPLDVAKCRRAIGELANLAPATFPARNRYLLDAFFPEFEKAGPAHEMLMSYHSLPIAGAEWSVPVRRFEAAFDELQAEVASGRLFLPVVWLKKVKGETAWLSAADEDCVQCGMYHDVYPETPTHVKEMVTRVEPIMARHGGRPHLGKLFYMKPADLRRVYPNWKKFDAVRRQLDPEGMFWTADIEARFGGADD